MQNLEINCDLDIRDCGLMAYREALDLQHKLVDQRTKDEISNTVLILEHRPVITLGVRKDLNKLLVAEGILEQRGIELATVRRGGGCTAHNPGQVVLYPIIKLSSLGLGVNDYIRGLEAIGLELLEHLGVEAQRLKGQPGLWTSGNKIGSIGVRITKGVTFHGMAINIRNDLSIFEVIVPCGLKGVRITSVLKQADKDPSMAQAKQRLAGLCLKHLTGQNGDSLISEKANG
ncbi:MAG: lipoyl(octanoyl) transferase LipB [Planctomycetota bacterium]|jgi:lipoate-protein ligase B